MGAGGRLACALGGCDDRALCALGCCARECLHFCVVTIKHL